MVGTLDGNASPSQGKCPPCFCHSHACWEHLPTPFCVKFQTTLFHWSASVFFVACWFLRQGLYRCILLAYKAVLWPLPSSGITWLSWSTDMKLATNFSDVFTGSPASFSVYPRKFLFFFFDLFVCLCFVSLRLRSRIFSKICGIYLPYKVFPLDLGISYWEFSLEIFFFVVCFILLLLRNKVILNMSIKFWLNYDRHLII